MYRILSGNNLIYDSKLKNGYPCIEPNLTMELGEAGSLTFTLLPGHPMRNSMKEMQTFVTAYQDDEENPIFDGRVLMVEEDLDKRLTLTCEGALTFLLDTEMEPGTYTETVSAFFTRCVEAHNSQVEDAKKFDVGTIDHDDANKTMTFKLEGYSQTKSVLETLLVKKHGGFLHVRYQNGHRYLDFVQILRKIVNQPIRTGYNLQSVQKQTNGENIFTVLRPLGKNDLTIEGASASNLLSGVTFEGDIYGFSMGSQSNTPVSTVMCIWADTVTLRSSPSTDAEVIERVPVGTEVTVLDDATYPGWSQIEVNSTEGYMMSQYLLSNSISAYAESESEEDEEEEDTWVHTSDYVSVQASQTYTSGPSPIKVSCYDANHAFLYDIEDLNKNKTVHYFKTSENTAYIIMSCIADYDVEQQLHLGRLPLLTKFTAGTKVIDLPERHAKYGYIIHTEKFNEITAAQELYNEAIKWLSLRYATLPISMDCGIVDMHLLNPNIDAFEVGDIYDEIEDFADEIMIIATLKKDFENPANDTATLKNMAELFGTDGSGGSSGSMSSKYAKSKKK